jgi:hypothetical protein
MCYIYVLASTHPLFQERKMTVGELRKLLEQYSDSLTIVIDVSRDEVEGWEGDRVVRNVESVHLQRSNGPFVSLDAAEYTPLDI